LQSVDVARLRIINYPDPRLRKACKPIEAFDASVARLADRMIQLMHQAKGVGLAAPQVGVTRRMFVCNVTGQPDDDLVFINPQLTDLVGRADCEEGCLSLPDVTATVRRASQCTIHAFDVSGRPFTLTGKDLLARCWQHETDHLDGRLITDRMPEAERLANRRALKYLEAEFKKKAAAS